MRLVGWLVRRGRFVSADARYARGSFHRLGWAVPLWVVWSGLAYLPRPSDAAIDVATRLVTVGLLFVTASTVVAAIRAFGDARVAAHDAHAHPMKGYLQAAILPVYVGAAVVSISVLVDRSRLLIVGGLGAASAVVALIFRDPILSLVAGIQLTSSELIQVGDRIEMPKFDAHGSASWSATRPRPAPLRRPPPLRRREAPRHRRLDRSARRGLDGPRQRAPAHEHRDVPRPRRQPGSGSARHPRRHADDDDDDDDDDAAGVLLAVVPRGRLRALTRACRPTCSTTSWRLPVFRPRVFQRPSGSDLAMLGKTPTPGKRMSAVGGISD